MFDCPPSLGVLTLNALVAVDEVFIPLQPHFLALHGFSKLLETIHLVVHAAQSAAEDQRRGGLHVQGQYAIGRRGEQNVDEFSGRARAATPWANTQIFQTRIRRNVRLAEAPSFGQSIFQYSPDSHGAEDYRRLADEVRAVA